MQGKTQCACKRDTDVGGSGDRETKFDRRLKFWETDRIFKCPLVGMCLTLAEQKKLLKKTDFSVRRSSLFEIHEALVSCSGSENHVSRRMDSLLHRKYGREAEPLLELSHGEFVSLFKKAFESGDACVFLWAAAISPDLPDVSKREIFGEFHMAMHFNAEQSAALKEKLALRKSEIEDMRGQIETATRSRRALARENERLGKENADLLSAAAVAEEEKKRMEAEVAGSVFVCRIAELENERRALEERLNSMAERARESMAWKTSVEEENARLHSEVERLRKSEELFQEEIGEIMADLVALKRCDSDCPAFDLCSKRVLMVGGISKMESLYRKLVEDSGGVFEYHDGYMKKGAKKLESCLRRADVVLCPVSCNSHGACSVVKNLAKKHGKSVRMLDNSSLSAVSQAIRGAEHWRPGINCPL